MVLQHYKTANLAKGKLIAGISASASSMILESGQGGLFPTTYPYLLKIEKFDPTSTLENKPVIKREIVKVTNKSGDTFSITRSSGTCPADDAATTQTTTAFSFDSGDSITLVDNSEIYEDMYSELERLETDKADDDEVVKLTGDQSIDGIKTFEESPIVPTPTTDYQASTKKYVDDEIIQAQQTSELIDDSFMLGEAILAGQCAFLETGPTTAVAITKQNIGDVAGNTRVSFPVIGTGVASDTFKVNICKTGSTHPTNQGLYFRIETDNAGSPSGTLVDSNAIAHILPADLTTSLADTTMTLAGNITIAEGQKCHLVAFQSTSDDYADTVIDTDYYNIGYSTNDTTTRGLSTYDGSGRGNAPVSTTDADGFIFNAGTNFTSSAGYKLQAKTNLFVSIVNKNASCTATKAYIKTTAGVLLATATFVGDVATFSTPYQFTNGDYFVIDLGSDGSLYASRYLASGVTYPKTGTNIDYISGYYGGDMPTEAYNIDSITTLVGGASSTTKFCYISSILFQDQLLSLTDSDFAYKVDLKGISIENKGIGTYPKLTIQGINGEQSGMLKDYQYFLGATPGSISATAGTNARSIGYAISDTKLFLHNTQYNIVSGTTYTLGELLNDVLKNNTSYAKYKSMQIPKSGMYTVIFKMTTDGNGKSRIYRNGVAYGTEWTGTTMRTQNLRFDAGDTCELWAYGDGNNVTADYLQIKYSLSSTPYNYLSYNNTDY